MAPDGFLANGTSEDATIPIHIVTHASQLPSEFLNPSVDNQLVVGFDCEGIDLCRHGGLCLMQIAFTDAIYLVDTIEGGDALVRACKTALESSCIAKVIHDCKRDSEALYFQYDIKLHNVVDTQLLNCILVGQASSKNLELGWTKELDNFSLIFPQFWTAKEKLWPTKQLI